MRMIYRIYEDEKGKERERGKKRKKCESDDANNDDNNNNSSGTSRSKKMSLCIECRKKDHVYVEILPKESTLVLYDDHINRND